MANSLGTGGRGNDLAPESGHDPLAMAGSPLERASNPMLSLDALKDASLHSPPIRNSMPDSGKIVLSNLPKTAPVGAPAILDALPALGTAQSEAAEKKDAEAPKSFLKQRGLGIGIAIAGIAVAGALIYSLRTPAPAQATTPVVAPAPQAAETASTPTATAVVTADPAAPTAEQASAAPKAASKNAATKKTQAASTGDNPYAGQAAPTAAPEPAPTPTQTAAPAPKPNPCGCAAEDLKCNMDCAVKGKK